MRPEPPGRDGLRLPVPNGAAGNGLAQPAPHALAGELGTQGVDHFDSLSVAALLESVGLRDVDARERHAVDDIFALGSQVFPAMPAATTSLIVPERRRSPADSRREFLRRYAAGLSFLLLTAVQVGAFVAFGYSLWAWRGFSSAQATMVAVATMLSLLATAPSVQGIAHRGRHYRGLNNAHLLSRELRRLSRFGAGSAVLVGAVAVAGGLLAGAGTAHLHEFCEYYALLAVFWVAAARLDVLGRRLLTPPVTLAGIAVIWALRRWGATSMVEDQWLGLAAVDLALLALGETRLRRLRRGDGPLSTLRPLLPARALIARIWPVLVYGLLYYLLLFADRLVAWTAGPMAPGRRVAFRGDYEAGLDWALLVLFLSTAMLEYSIQAFSEHLIPAAARTPATDRRGLATAIRGVCLRHLLALTAIASIALALGFAILSLLPAWGHGGELALFQRVMVRQVYLSGAAGYLLLALGLFGSALLRSLGRSQDVLKALLPAVAVDLAAGAVAVQVYGYRWATLGLIAGAAVFVATTAVYVASALRHAPYNLSRTLI